jgi:hypothetical protein
MYFLSFQSPTNIFIVNLAISDVLMCLFAVPFTPLHSFMGEWVFGEFLCKLFPTSQVINYQLQHAIYKCMKYYYCPLPDV